MEEKAAKASLFGFGAVGHGGFSGHTMAAAQHLKK